MKTIVFLADGFEEIEALTVVDYLRRMDIEVEMVSITEDKKVKGAHDIEVMADSLLNDLKDVSKYDGVVIPGGMPGASNLRDDERVIEIVREQDKKDKLIGAICAGPIVLERAGIIEGKKVTSYPGFEDDLEKSNYLLDGVVVDKNIITGRGPAYAVDFAIEIVKYLLGEEKSSELEDDILYSEKNNG